MYSGISKDMIRDNITEIINSEFYHDLYNRCVDSDDLKVMEEKSAQIFNTLLFASQLTENKEAIQNIMTELMERSLFNHGGTMITGNIFEMVYLDILQRHEPYYLENGHEKMIERLKHGVAVHFTTPAITERISQAGVLYAHESLFSREIEDKIKEAGKYQMEHSKEAEKTGMYLHLGAGMGKGISMGAQTVDFWMNHTPESLTFLFGGKVFTRNKDGAMEYVEECISTLPEEQKKEMMNIMEEIWENVVGSDKSLGCVLIDRDSMEYETVTYWGETPPRVEEIRPYRNGTLDSFSAMEESRYERDIPVSGLRFVKVPSIFELEKYRSEHPIDPKQRIGYFEESELEYTYEDIFSDEAFEDNTAPKNNRDSAGSDDFGEI